MPKFALAFISFGDNELKISFVEGPSDVSVACTFLADQGWVTSEEDIAGLNAELAALDDMEALKKWCFDGDCMIDVKELPSA